MPHFFILLFKINLVLILFAATYYLVLRRLTFYTINRMFLLFGILFSSAYPFINLTEFFNRHKSIQAFVPKVNENVHQFVQNDGSIYWQWLTILFYAGVLCMALRLIIQFISLRRMHKNSSPGSVEQYKVRILSDEVSPFSFWQTIYINPLLHKKQDLHNILEHEKVHVEEWHTLDIILAEVCVVFYWFNPGVWLMKKAVRENIEFITDAKILKKGVDKKAYQYSLLDVGTLEPSVAIVNNFNLSDLKKRIRMMNSKKSSSLNLTRYLFALPILAVTLAFTINKKDIQKTLVPLRKIVNQVLPEKKDETLSVAIPEKRINLKRKKMSIEASKVDTAKKLTLLMHQILTNKDSSDKIVKIILKNTAPGNENKSVEDKIKEMSLNTFTFTDSLSKGEKTHVKNITIVARIDNGEKKIIRRQYNTSFVMTGTGTISKDSLHVTKPRVYFLNGQKISKEEAGKLQPDLISGILLGKDGWIDITPTQK